MLHLAEQGCSSSGDALGSREALAAVQTASLALLQAQSVAFAIAGQHETNVRLLVSYGPLARILGLDRWLGGVPGFENWHSSLHNSTRGDAATQRRLITREGTVLLQRVISRSP